MTFSSHLKPIKCRHWIYCLNPVIHFKKTYLSIVQIAKTVESMLSKEKKIIWIIVNTIYVKTICFISKEILV